MSVFHRFRSNYAALSLLLLASGCDPEEPSPPSPPSATDAVLLEWQDTAFESAVRMDGLGNPFWHMRALAMVHLATHDALNGIDLRYQRYASEAEDPKAHPDAAVASAAHGVLAVLYADQAGILDDALATTLAAVPDGDAETRGVELGRSAAAAVLAGRSGDGIEQCSAYVPGTEPGEYQFTPPFDFAFCPEWGAIQPFVSDSTSQFRAPPPPALTDPEYTEAFQEMVDYGRREDSSRTSDQTAYADFWYELTAVGWNTIARTLWTEHGNGDAWEAARLFAMLHTSQIESSILSFESKYHYRFWRPLTAIRAADGDGNSDTEPQADWEPYCITPPVPDYPSAHASNGAAAATVIASFFGRDDLAFTFASSTGNPPEATRSFTSLTQAVLENADSRVACGIHWSFAADAGVDMGYDIGAQVVDRMLQPMAASR
jgi:hypothetical protein